MEKENYHTNEQIRDMLQVYGEILILQQRFEKAKDYANRTLFARMIQRKYDFYKKIIPKEVQDMLRENIDNLEKKCAKARDIPLRQLTKSQANSLD